MARKKKSDEEVEKPKFTKEQVQTGLSILHQEYFMQAMSLMSYDPDNKKVEDVKVTIETPEGGVYLVSILHIEGPQLDLQTFTSRAEEYEKAQKEKKDVL